MHNNTLVEKDKKTWMWHEIQISCVGFIVDNSPVEYLNLLNIMTVVGFLVIATNQNDQQYVQVEH